MSFGKYAIADAVTHYFEQEPDWWWKIKPVTSGMELEMSKFLSHNRISLVYGEAKESPPTNMEIAFREIAMTFDGTNIPLDESKPVAEGGEPYIKDDASIDEVEFKLAGLPRTLLMEIWRAVGESYPYWGPSNPKVE